MKSNILLFLLFLVAMTAVVYVAFRASEYMNPTLSSQAVSPDLHLQNIKKYMKEHDQARSILHLDKAIAAIKVIETDVDIHSGEVLENAVHELEEVRPILLGEEADMGEVSTAISRTLAALSFAELRVSESYAETNKLKVANKALRYAKIHLKNAMIFSDGLLRDRELHIYQEMDSLLKHPEMYSVDVVFKMDQMIGELEVLVGQQ